jgi:hypothetical protein
VLRKSLLVAALAASVSFPTLAFADPDPLTDEAVAGASARDCGYVFSIPTVMEKLYGKDARVAYEKDHDLVPAKYADQVAAVHAWMEKRLDELAPAGKTYSFWRYVEVKRGKDGSGTLQFFPPQVVVSGFPDDWCGFSSRGFRHDMGDIGWCNTQVSSHPFTEAEINWTLGFNQSFIDFAIPAGLDPSSTLGGEPGDRSAIVEIEGQFAGCTVRNKSLGGGTEKFWPTTVRVYGVKHGMMNSRGAKWFINYQLSPFHMVGNKQSSAYQDLAGAPIVAMTFPLPKITSSR